MNNNYKTLEWKAGKNTITENLYNCRIYENNI